MRSCKCINAIISITTAGAKEIPVTIQISVNKAGGSNDKKTFPQNPLFAEDVESDDEGGEPMVLVTTTPAAPSTPAPALSRKKKGKKEGR